MKILHIIPTLAKGGAERLVLDIIKQLNKKDTIEARLVIFRDEIKYDISEIKEFISIIPSFVKLSLTKKWILNVSDLKDYIDNFEPDVVHSHLFEAELVSRFCNYPKARWFSHLHDNMVQLKKWSWSSFSKSSITNWYEKQILFRQYKKNGGTNFIAISKLTESYIKSVQSKYPVTLLHNAINVKRFQKPTGFEKISSNLNLSNEGGHSFSALNLNPQSQPSALNLINIGSFNENKNQQFLIEIIKNLLEKDVKVNCVFLGSGPMLNVVKKKVIQNGIQEMCIFKGNVENVEEYLWSSDIYVHTAKSEALGLTILEAMAAGLPVVSLDGGGNRDLIIDGKNGFLIEKQDPKVFADRILQVFQNKEISDFNSEYANQFDIESYCENLLTLYNHSH